MATTYVTLTNLQRYDSNLKTYIDSNKTKSLKSLAVVDNKINFYRDAAPTEGADADFVVDLPVEFFLDQTKTVFVQEFVWSEAVYVGSTNPNLDGKPVLVLAVKGDNNTVVYSFLNMETLIDIYTGEATKSITLTVTADNKISADVIISATEGNILSIKDDGLYVATPEAIDISGKADKLVNPEEGAVVIKAAQILVDDGTGNLAASGKTIAEVTADILANFEAISDEEIDNLFA